MASNNQIESNLKSTYEQQFIFKLLAKIQFGKLTITDPTGIHSFIGNNGIDTHAVQLTVHNLKTYKRVLFGGTLAAGETYMQGFWDTDELTKFIEIILKNKEIFEKIDGPIPKILNLLMRFGDVFNNNDIPNIKKNILTHYDLGNEFFMQFLDPSMMYSCALFEPENISLAQASAIKLDSICQQLQLQPSDHLLEIGTGWGGFAIHAARKYGCKITTTTISDKQYTFVNEEIQRLGLQNQITLLNVDYRELTGQYDKLVSIEMIEAIGYKYFDTFFKQCDKLVKPQGLLFLQAILINDQAYPRAKDEVDFIRKYIFPGGCLPSIGAISQSVAKHTQLQLISLSDIGQHYSKTLLMWLQNLNKNIGIIKQQGFTDQFIRMWRYYFCYCAAAFRQNYITDIHALWRKRE